MESRDSTLDTLLDLDGQIMILNEKGEYWVKFNGRRVAVTPERPHGPNYSLTLHGKDNERLVGFDNAHPARHPSRPGGKGPVAHDYKTPPPDYSTVSVSRCNRLARGLLDRGGCGTEGKRSREMNVLKVGIASYEDMKARTMAIARGTLKPKPGDPKV